MFSEIGGPCRFGRRFRFSRRPSAEKESPPRPDRATARQFRMEFASVPSRSGIVRSTNRRSIASSPSAAAFPWKPLREPWRSRTSSLRTSRPPRGISSGIWYFSRVYSCQRGRPGFSPRILKDNRAATRARRYQHPLDTLDVRTRFPSFVSRTSDWEKARSKRAATPLLIIN